MMGQNKNTTWVAQTSKSSSHPSPWRNMKTPYYCFLNFQEYLVLTHFSDFDKELDARSTWTFQTCLTPFLLMYTRGCGEWYVVQQHQCRIEMLDDESEDNARIKRGKGWLEEKKAEEENEDGDLKKENIEDMDTNEDMHKEKGKVWGCGWEWGNGWNYDSHETSRVAFRLLTVPAIFEARQWYTPLSISCF